MARQNFARTAKQPSPWGGGMGRERGSSWSRAAAGGRRVGREGGRGARGGVFSAFRVSYCRPIGMVVWVGLDFFLIDDIQSDATYCKRNLVSSSISNHNLDASPCRSRRKISSRSQGRRNRPRKRLVSHQPLVPAAVAPSSGPHPPVLVTPNNANLRERSPRPLRRHRLSVFRRNRLLTVLYSRHRCRDVVPRALSPRASSLALANPGTWWTLGRLSVRSLPPMRIRERWGEVRGVCVGPEGFGALACQSRLDGSPDRSPARYCADGVLDGLPANLVTFRTNIRLTAFELLIRIGDVVFVIRADGIRGSGFRNAEGYQPDEAFNVN
ncbi:hypothetical protein GWI33_005561 [Rhynchophorus ferrugineus]|uniref:Uncharacterized protein n=1 Tax=Rhynchophorus ferrugineus TaxID=354439 RepID=A0A834IH89_RHYFE|nr:hypothetical protein GWI33_005561 [Rhynchophorus ferrugineus]